MYTVMSLLDIFLETLSGLISLYISFFSVKAYKLTRDRILKYLQLSFLLIGLATILRVGLNIMSYISRYFEVALSIFNLIYILSTLVAYFSLSYIYSGRELERTLTSNLLIFVGYHSLAIFLLSYIVLNIALWVGKEAKIAIAGYSLIAFSHLLSLFTPYWKGLAILENFPRLIGFILLLLLVVRAERIGKNVQQI